MSKLKIIIAEDNHDFSETLRLSFENDSFFTVNAVCRDGLEALAAMEAEMPDVLLLDLIMPEADGFTVLSQLAAMDKKPSIIFVVSQIKSESFIEKALSLGATYYFPKPVTYEILRERILEFSSLTPSSSLRTLSKEQISHNARPQPRRGKVTVDEKLSNIFISVGIPAHIKGYQFLREAIKMAICQPEIINSITKKLYPHIATKYETSSSKVERAIRHAIEVAWSRGRVENINSLFGIKIYNPNDKPTNGEFIALIADKMLLEGYSA